MKTLPLALAAGLIATAAAAQTTSTSPNGTAPAVNGTAPTVTMAPNAAMPRTGAAAASGNNNQAVVTTTANAPQPAKGANSFSEGEARRRIESEGYATVADLKKDGDGVWRGSAMKNSAKVAVWLDYKGNIGQQ